MSPPPAHPKIYHIVHVDRLRSIIADGCLWSHAEAVRTPKPGTIIGMGEIKARRLRLELQSRPGLHVGGCVPFYFCPRSIMLFLLHKANHPEVSYRGGQEPIVHLVSDMHSAIEWAEANGRRWAFTLSNAGAAYFEDRCDVNQLGEINWLAVQATKWSGPNVSGEIKEGKQAEFLMEHSFPWTLVEKVAVYSQRIAAEVSQSYGTSAHRPTVEVKSTWYY